MLVLGRVSWPLAIILIPECFGIWGKDSLIRRFGRYKNAPQIMSKNRDTNPRYIYIYQVVSDELSSILDETSSMIVYPNKSLTNYCLYC